MIPADLRLLYLTMLHACSNFYPTLRLGRWQERLGTYMRVCALLTNVHTTLYGSQVGDFFKLKPPTLHAYLHSEHEPDLHEAADLYEPINAV
jgi:hypothetical protein